MMGDSRNQTAAAAPTPSPLRRLEDPSAYHVMPSRKKREEASSSKSSASMLMPPPAPRIGGGKKTEVLDEDTFVDALSEIIERDFFPNLPKLQRQVRWLEALESRDVHTIREMRRVILAEQGHVAVAGTTPLVGTPLVGGPAPGSGTVEVEEERPSVLEDRGINPKISLDQFLRRYQSEDDASFDDLADRMREAHRRKYWWVYEHPAIEAGKEKLYLLADGSFLTEEQKKLRIKAVDAEAKRGDDRPNAPDGNVYRVRNALMFLPDADQAKQISKVGQQSQELPLLLTNGDGGGGGGQLALSTLSNNPRVGSASKGPREVAHKNTRLDDSDGGGSIFPHPSPIERARSDLSSLSSESFEANALLSNSNQGYVPMTPVMIPGAGGQSPFITWGDIEGTPLRVTETFDSKQVGSQFKMQVASHREKVASNLESKARRRKGSATPQVYHQASATTPRPTTPLSSSTPSRKRPATPAAQLLAQRLAKQSSQRDDPFGGAASQLRQSYTQKPGGGGAGRGGVVSTGGDKGQMTPLGGRGTPGPIKKAKVDTTPAPSDGAKKGTGLTDNLLV